MYRIPEVSPWYRSSASAFLLAASFLAVPYIAAQMPGQKAPGPPPAQVEQTRYGFHATAGTEVLEVTVCTDSVIHVVTTPNPSASESPKPWMLDAQQSCPGAAFTFSQDSKAAAIKTSQLEVSIGIERGNLSFSSLSGTSEDYTIQRPLVMDWRTDPKVWSLGDQFMFGPALLVNPVLKADTTKREVYFPAAAGGYDFWSGESLKGGQEIEADAPLDRIPIFVRAGSIVPKGPQIEYASQNPEGPIDVRIYRGADGDFNLYEDAGDGYGYEQGQHSLIPLRWNDHTSTLTIGDREVPFPE